ncbi:MAG: porin [Hyphomicrobium sp.]|nr:MAG: porin [Hyphomicrobium sp.]
MTMAFKRATLLLSAALIFGGTQNGVAADLYGGGMKDEPVYQQTTSAGRGVYFRIDGGYAAYDDPVVSENGVFPLTEISADETWSIGGGVGMSLGGGFRGDVTYEYRSPSEHSATLAVNGVPQAGVRTFDVESQVFLANLYYDFDLGSRITPYIGFGLGFARNKTGVGNVEDLCGCDIGDIESATKTHVAAAAMAGLSMKLRGGTTTVGSFKDGPVEIDTGRALFLDVGYRFLYLGEAETGPVVDNSGNRSSDDPTVEDIHAHEIRAGLRYQLN